MKNIAKLLCLHIDAPVRGQKIGCFWVNIALKQYKLTIANLDWEVPKSF